MMDLSKLGTVGAVLYAKGAKGKQNAVKRAEVLLALGKPDTPSNRRLVSKWLEEERETVIIVGDSTGLYFPESLAEVEHYYRLQAARAKGIFRTIKTARLYIKAHGGQVDGQTILEEMEGV